MSTLDLSVSFPSRGMIRLQSSTLFGDADSPNCRSFLERVFQAEEVSGVTLTGSGAGSFSGTTGATGCVLWRNLPAGNYTMTAGGAASGMVDPDGNAPTGQTVSVVDQATNTVNLQYDLPGSIPVTFTTRRQSDNAIVSTLPTVPSTRPTNAERSSSTACGVRATLATQRRVSFWSSRR